MADYFFSFEYLEAWQVARKLVVKVYKLVRKLPNEERFALCDQLRRAVVSVPSNIAEGNSRTSLKDQIHFLDIALGSLSEVYCQLILAVDLGYLTDDDLNSVKAEVHSTSRLIKGLKGSKEAKLNP